MLVSSRETAFFCTLSMMYKVLPTYMVKYTDATFSRSCTRLLFSVS